MAAQKKRGQSRHPARWNIDSMVASLGGIVPLIDHHAAMGFSKLSYSQVGQWLRRRNIPADRLAEVLLTIRKVNKGADPWRFINAAL